MSIQAIIYLFFVYFFITQLCKKNIPALLKIAFMILLFLFSLVDYCNFPSKHFQNNNIINQLSTFYKLKLKSSDVIALSALSFTLFTSIRNNLNDKKRREEDIIASTFFQLQDIIVERSKSITEEYTLTLINQIKNSFTSKDKTNLIFAHNTYKLMTILKDEQSKIYLAEIKNTNTDLFNRLNILIAEDNKERFYCFLLNKHIKKSLNVNAPIQRKKTFELTYEEFSIFKNSNFFKYIKKKYNETNFLKESITYEHAFDIVNNILSSQTNIKNSDFFRILHRAIKLINDSNIEDKDKYYGILRASLPDYLLIYTYYNSLFSDKGLGLGLQLVGTSFFGDRDDVIYNKHNVAIFSQHMPTNLLIFKRQDLKVINDIFSDENSIEDISSLKESASVTFQKNSTQSVKSFNHKPIKIDK